MYPFLTSGKLVRQILILYVLLIANEKGERCGLLLNIDETTQRYLEATIEPQLAAPSCVMLQSFYIMALVSAYTLNVTFVSSHVRLQLLSSCTKFVLACIHLPKLAVRFHSQI